MSFAAGQPFSPKIIVRPTFKGSKSRTLPQERAPFHGNAERVVNDGLLERKEIGPETVSAAFWWQKPLSNRCRCDHPAYTLAVLQAREKRYR
jgi:hypothetical protein